MSTLSDNIANAFNLLNKTIDESKVMIDTISILKKRNTSLLDELNTAKYKTTMLEVDLKIANVEIVDLKDELAKVSDDEERFSQF